ncbi:putative colanic acid biosynthesis acetyltransferase [Rhizobium puerariae]|uniref:Colanic acid biosynthesis acetyltransferase n=1 Tax=Rhizobium puerariae TaxID=1585791 RepID=A0ABV6ALT2_9HYPH
MYRDLTGGNRTHPKEGGPSFALGHRLFRAAWNVTWAVFGRWTPAPLHGWRRTLLKLFGASLEKTSRVYPGVRVWFPPNLSMGHHATLGPDVICYCMDRVLIGDHAVVSQRAHLCGGTHDPDHPDFPLIAKPIVIGSHAWIAAEAFVGPGVAVGEGAVLGARAVAVRNLESNVIYAGNPARPIRERKRV